MRPRGRRPAPVGTPVEAGYSVIEIGRIVARHGIRGDVRIQLHNPDSQVLPVLSHLVVQRGDRIERCRLLSARPHKHVWLARIEGINTANDADDLIGSTISVPRQEMPALADGEVYYAELIGCPVRSDTGAELGSIARVFSNGSHDVCVVEHDDREYLIPLVADVVAELNVTAADRRLVIRPLPGLLGDD